MRHLVVDLLVAWYHEVTSPLTLRKEDKRCVQTRRPQRGNRTSSTGCARLSIRATVRNGAAAGPVMDVTLFPVWFRTVPDGMSGPASFVLILPEPLARISHRLSSRGREGARRHGVSTKVPPRRA